MQEVTSAQNQPLASYRYDPLGRRIQKTTPTKTTYYLYTDEGLIGEYDPSGATIATYGYRPQSEYQTTPLWKKTQYGYAYYHRDHLGTPLMLTDKTNAVVWEARYKAFGERNILTAAIANNLGFPGQYYEEETGLWQNWFRDYDHRTGRYVEGDPIGLGGGVNGYVYANMNPLLFIDPFGQVSYGGDTDEILLCTYYTKICKKKGGNCRYYCVIAPAMCTLGEYSPIMVGVDEQEANCIRRCLIREDKKAWNNSDNLTGECDGECVKDDVIDQYHVKCFKECDVNPIRYPGVPPGLGNGN